jgi:hypothetical protein
VVRLVTVVRVSKLAAGAWVAGSYLPQPTMPPLFFFLIVRVARNAPIVSVAHGWGCVVEAKKNNSFLGDGLRPEMQWQIKRNKKDKRRRIGHKNRSKQ